MQRRALQDPQRGSDSSALCPALTPCRRRWVPGTARFVVLGSRPRGTGVLQVYDLDGLELQQVAQAEQPHSLQCGSFGASAAADAHLAVGTQAGQLRLLDVARLDAGPLFSVQAHAGNVNALDAFGGQVGRAGRHGAVLPAQTI